MWSNMNAACFSRERTPKNIKDYKETVPISGRKELHIFKGTRSSVETLAPVRMWHSLQWGLRGKSNTESIYNSRRPTCLDTVWVPPTGNQGGSAILTGEFKLKMYLISFLPSLWDGVSPSRPGWSLCLGLQAYEPCLDKLIFLLILTISGINEFQNSNSTGYSRKKKNTTSQKAWFKKEKAAAATFNKTVRHFLSFR